MSLVVAQTTTNGPQIVSDTRVTFADGMRPSYKTGTLKTVILSGGIAVSFAGNVRQGLDAIRQFAIKISNGLRHDRAISSLAATASETDVEFIVAISAPNAPLFRVRRTGLEELAVTWIGDPLAFEAFQAGRVRHRASPLAQMTRTLPESVQTMAGLGVAMRTVIENPRIASVDDFCLRTIAKDGEFEYLEESFTLVGRDIQLRDGDSLISKMAQPVSDGGYAVSSVPPVERGVPALGLNFPRARLGLLYLPLDFDGAQVIQDVRAGDFSGLIEKRFGVRLKDPMLREH